MAEAFNTQTLTRRRSRSRADRRAPYLFLVIAGHDLDIPPSRHDLSDLDRVVLGRGDLEISRVESAAGLELRVRIPDSAMSGKHAVLEKSALGWTVRDLGSKNGVYLDGRLTSAAELSEGCVIELGQTFFIFKQHLGPIERDDQIGPTHADAALATLIPKLNEQFDRLLQVAPSAVTVLVTGETGTGKELITRAVHKMSGRSGSCVAVNCGALPSNLVESELFGYRKGAFSGAVEDRIGLVRAADGGTLFLDEIGELPLPAQVALLRVLEQRAVTPVGATREIPVDFRLCAATHRDLAEAARSETFRADLLGRVSGFHVELPPLRNRREDLGLLVRAITGRLQRSSEKITLTNDAIRALLGYRWPQNNRELTKCLETALVLARDGCIDLPHLPGEIADACDGGLESDPAVDDEPVSLPDDGLRERLHALLSTHRGNVSAVARAMNKDRVQIRRWMLKLKLDIARYRGSGNGLA